MDLAIFGAQGYALGAYEAIKELCPKRTVSCFLVSAIGNNATCLGGLEVKELDSFAKDITMAEREKVQILISTPDNVQPEIEELLEDYGFKNYIRIDSNRWAELAKLFHVRLGRFLPLEALLVGYNKPFLRMFMARSQKDRPLKKNVELPDHVFPIQVGAVGCDIRVADLADTTGDNISARNCNYSELSGLYWIWKNKLLAKRDDALGDRQYYGLVQYRRMFDFSEDDLLRIYDNDVDVILPYPLPYEPDINAHHERYVKKQDWEVLLRVLEELHPEYADYFPKVLGQKYLYNYNVILAKKEILREYCEWLFPILQHIEEQSIPKGNERSDRYIGYIGESLETLYFMKNSDKLNIVHTACKMLV